MDSPVIVAYGKKTLDNSIRQNMYFRHVVVRLPIAKLCWTKLVCWMMIFFFSGEDVDLAWRAQLAGYRCVYIPDALVYHQLSATGGGVSPVATMMVAIHYLFAKGLSDCTLAQTLARDFVTSMGSGMGCDYERGGVRQHGHGYAV